MTAQSVFYFEPGGRPVVDLNGTDPTGWQLSFFAQQSANLEVGALCV